MSESQELRPCAAATQPVTRTEMAKVVVSQELRPCAAAAEPITRAEMAKVVASQELWPAQPLQRNLHALILLASDV